MCVPGQLPICRQTGQVPYQDFTCPVSALIRSYACLFPKGMGILVALSSFCFRPSQQQQHPYGQGQQQWDVQVQIVQEHVDIQVEGHGNND